MKRSRPATSNRADESANKVARRKTWFGFGSSQTDPDPEVRASDSSRSPFGGAGHDTTVLSPEEAAFRAALFAGGEVPAAQGSKVSRKQSLDPAETAHPQVQTHESVSPPSKDVQLPSQGAPVDKTSGNAKSPEGSGAMDYATATLRANTRRSINAAKRASWIRWKDPEPTSESPAKPTEEAGGEATSEDPSSSAPRSDHLADKKPGGSELLAVPSSSLPTESPRESTDSASSNRSRAPLARTIKRRTWLGQMVEEPQMESPPSSPLPFGAASQSNSKSEAALSTIAEPTAGKDRPDEGADSDPVRPAKRDTSVKSAPLRRIFSRAQIDASTGASASSNTGEGSGTASAAPEPAAKTSEPPQSPSPSHALPAPAEKNPQDSSITPAASASGTWRFSLWGRGEPAQSEAADSTPVAPEPPSSSGVEVAKDQALPATDNHATLSPNPGSTDGELNAPTATSSVADAGSNYTYSSYLARWLPSWSYDSAQAPIGEADSQGQGGDKVPSPAEQVKAEALARQETTESKDAPKPDTDAKADSERSIGSASASSNPRNAILNNATRSSWISYFASRK